MNNLGPWLGFAFDELKRNWKDHMVPSMAMFALTLVVTFGLMFIGFAVAGVLVLLASLVSQDLAAAAAIIGWAVGLPLSIAAIVFCITPLVIGHYRITLRILRGEPWQLSEIVAFDGLGKALVANLLGGLATMLAAMACYLPAIPVSVLFFFSLPLIADNKVDSGMDAVRQSIALARQDFWGLCAYWFVALLIGMVVAYIPFVGAFLSMPLFTLFILTPYLKLSEGGEQPAQLTGASVDVARDLANPYTSPRKV